MKQYTGDVSTLYDRLRSESAEDSRHDLRFLRGTKMKIYSTFFDEVSAVMQFPPYFGENWNAYDECMADLSWLNCDLLTLCIIDSDLVLATEKTEAESWVEHLQRVVEEKAVGDEFSDAVDIRVILHSASETARSSVPVGKVRVDPFVLS